MGRELASMTAKVDEVLQQTQRAFAERPPIEIPEDSGEDDPPYDFLSD